MRSIWGNVSQRPFRPAELPIWAVGILQAIIVRPSLLNFESVDYYDTLQPSDPYYNPMTYGDWYDFIASHGGFREFGYEFSDYSPLYLYLLTLATYLPLAKLYTIKLVPISFDLLLAFCATDRSTKVREQGGLVVFVLCCFVGTNGLC